jgi:hypothetical protein
MRNRSIAWLIILSIITLGLYDIYWICSTRNELVKKHQNVPSPLWIITPLLGLVLVAFVQIISHILLVNTGPNNPNALVGALNVFSATVGFICILAVIPYSIFWLWKYCEAVEAVTKGKMTTGFNFAICLLMSIFGIGFLWPPIVQDSFNKVK